MQLSDTTIVVTGASQGLGERMARTFVQYGANVVCAARSRDRLDRIVSDLQSQGDAIPVTTDVTNWDDVQALMRRATDSFGEVDVLVNNAGVSERALTGGAEPTVVDLPVDVWRTIIRTNLTGVFLCTKAVLPSMIESDSGRIIHVSSGMGQEGRANRSAYAASKCGLEAFHESLAEELTDTGIDSVVLDPGGGVDTKGFSGHMSEQERANRLDPAVVDEPAVLLAGGKGTNGGRYVATSELSELRG